MSLTDAERVKAYRTKHKIRLSEERRQKYKILDSSYIYKLFKRTERRAREKNIPFNITISDIVIPEYCPVFGIKLEASERGKTRHNSPSLDKIIPELGYTPENIIVVSGKANMIKSDATLDDLEKVVRFYRSLDH